MFNDLLLECITKPDPMLHLLEWLCAQLMEAEVDSKLAPVKGNEQARAPVIEAAIVSGNGILAWGLCIFSYPSSETEAMSLSF